jgi:hypothetical protein
MSDSDKELQFDDVFVQVRDALAPPLMVSYGAFIRLQIESLVSLYLKDPEEARSEHLSQTEVLHNLRMNGPQEIRAHANDVHHILHEIYRVCEKLLSEF